jgi:hypothetical protein
MVMDWGCMCKKSGEAIDELLIHCEVARELWVSVFRLFGFEWVVPERVVRLVVSWKCHFGSQYNLEVWSSSRLGALLYTFRV